MRTEEKIGVAFDEIVHKEIFQDIHKAINSLYFELHISPNESYIRYFDKMIKEMEIATQKFIEQQSTIYRNALTTPIGT